MHKLNKKTILVLITGCTQGLGLELSNYFDEFKCICLNRRKCKEDDLLIDLGESEIDLNNLKALLDTSEVIVFINNASTILPVKEIKSIHEKDLTYATNVNYLSPSKIILAITQSNKKFIVVNITTGAAFTSNLKLGAYSSTKAAMHRFIDILEKEEVDNENALLIRNFDPGRMQTQMQKTLIKEKDLEDTFNMLNTPVDVAKKVFEMISKELNGI